MNANERKSKLNESLSQIITGTTDYFYEIQNNSNSENESIILLKIITIKNV